MLASFTRRLFAVHPLLCAMAPILLLGSVNSDELEFWVLALPLAISVVAALGFWVVQAAIRRDWQKAGIITSLVAILFFTYGHFTNLIDNLGLVSSTSVRRALVLVPVIAILVGAEIMLRRVSQETAQKLTHCLGFGALMLCAISSVQLVDAWFDRERPDEIADVDKTLQFTHRPATLPDIYYIVLDGYARNDTLQEYYELDNSSFTDSLKEQGFFVADGSYSNYPVTRWSLASSLNMRYIHKEDRRGNETSFLFSLIRNNEVGRVLKAQGYRYVHFNTHWPGTFRCDLADESFPTTLPQFYNILADTTMIRSLWNPKTVDVKPPHILLYQFEKLKEIPKNPAPTFTMAHIICPHVPYWFDRHGNLKSVSDEDIWENAEEYREQLLFVNKKVQEAIDAIIAKSDSPPIIIVQADHGTVWPTESLPLESQTKHVGYRHGILSAVKAPPECLDQLYSTISPVNTFRVILNGLFEANLTLQEDRVFWMYPAAGNPMVEVTDALRLHDQTSRVAEQATSNVRR